MSCTKYSPGQALQLAKVSTDRDSDTDSQVYDLHVVYACINNYLENSRAVSLLAKGSNTTTVVVRAVENKMIFYKASLLYIAAGLCRIIQINLCIDHGHNAHTIFYLHHCLHSGRPHPRCPYLPLSLFVLWKINDYFTKHLVY